jgi:hypothetical protein
MTSSHIRYQFQLLRVSEIHGEAAAIGLANQVAFGHRAGLRKWLVRWLPAWRGRARGPQPHAAPDAP